MHRDEKKEWRDGQKREREKDERERERERESQRAVAEADANDQAVVYGCVCCECCDCCVGFSREVGFALGEEKGQGQGDSEAPEAGKF